MENKIEKIDDMIYSFKYKMKFQNFNIQFKMKTLKKNNNKLKIKEENLITLHL